MKHLLLTLLAFALFSSTLFAQWTQTAGPEGGLVYCVETVGDEIWAGTQGGLYTSDDEGETWQLSPDISSEDYVSRIIARGDTVIMLVTHYDAFYESYDVNLFIRTQQSASWTIHSVPYGLGSGVNLVFYNHFGLYLVGNDNVVYSATLGASWSTLAIPGNLSTIENWILDGNRIAIDGYIYDTTAVIDVNLYSDDGGITWNNLSAFPAGSYSNGFFLDDNLIILSSYDDTLHLSNDFGVTWQTVLFPNNHNPGAIRRGPDGNLYAAGDRMYRSNDNGLTWSTSQTAYIPSPSDLVWLDSGDLIGATSRGIYHISANFEQWLLSNDQLRISGANYLFSSPEGYVYASTSLSLRVTKNAGGSWYDPVPDSIEANGSVYDMLFLGDTIVAANYTNVLISFDNGVTWMARIPDGTNYFHIQGLEYHNGTLYVGTRKIHATSDWGQTWTVVPHPPDLYSLDYCTDLKSIDDHLFAVFQSGAVYKTTDQGQTWLPQVEIYTPGANRNNRLEYVNGALFVLGDGDPVYSPDEGLSWLELGKQGLPLDNSSGDEAPINFVAGLGNLLFVSIPWNGVWVSNNMGQSWEAFNEGLSNLRSRQLVFADSILYLGTSNAGVWRRGNQFKAVSGAVWHDNNNNGLQDPGELPYEDAIVSAQPLHAYSLTSFTGDYNIYAEVFNDTIRAAAITPYAIVTPPFYVVSQVNDSLNFGIYTIPNIVDLCITVTHMEPIRPGFDNSFVITVKNVGTTAASGLVRMGMPDGITYNGASPLPNQIVNDTLHWNIVDLEPNAIFNFLVSVTATSILTLGQTVSYAAEVLPFDDENPNNNINGERTEVVGSYDPNDKAVSPGLWLTPEALEAGEPLTYTIRFENTGTYFAEFIRITDTLSPLLDASTLQILSSSHPCTWTLKGPGIVEFFFSDIQLPWYEPEKHGFVKFSVKPKRNLELGDLVENTAFIYFDFNPAIVTNTVGTTVGYPTATRDPERLEILRFQPNPATDYVRVFWANAPKGINRVQLYDLEGRCLIDEKIIQTGDWITLPLPKLPNGNYTLYVIKEGRTAGGMVIVVQP